MWELTNPWWTYIVRSILVYTVVFVLLRIFGKKQLGEMGPFDLVLLLILSESISSSITGGDNSLSAGILCVTTFVLMNRGLDMLSFHFKWVEKVLDGKPKEIIRDGVINERVCKEEFITRDELISTLREHDHGRVEEIRQAILETNGRISIVKNPVDNLVLRN
jgi:Predicted membrane protein